jgi:hypothetical protein
MADKGVVGMLVVFAFEELSMGLIICLVIWVFRAFVFCIRKVDYLAFAVLANMFADAIYIPLTIWSVRIMNGLKTLWR